MVALHNYLLDEDGEIFARITTYGEDADEAEEIMEELDELEVEDEIEVVEESVAAPNPADLRRKG